MRSEMHDRTYMRSRLSEEIARSDRHGHPSSLIVFEAVPSSDGLPVQRKLRAAIDAISARVRPSDVLARLHDDTVMLLLTETERQGAQDALIRIGNGVANVAGNWRVTAYCDPQQRRQIDELARTLELA